MTHGFKFQTGADHNNTLSISNSSAAPGVLVDEFTVTYSAGTTTTKLYPDFSGTRLTAFMTAIQGSGCIIQTITVDNTAKSVSVVNGNTAEPALQGSVRITVLGV